jgi:2-polyprenyl-3-methyl-5-hydroxy-6-metoxy-1,4-benzoquinol methylase
VLARSRTLRERAFGGTLIDELLPWRAQPGRALDAGCGSGALMLSLASVGWEVEGVEWDSSAARVARESSGRPVWSGDFQAVGLPCGAYDLVVLHHVFEHLTDPLPALSRLAELLRPGGRAVLIYPNPESLGARLFTHAWFGWDVPRHFVLPPGDALAKYASSVLVPVRLRTTARTAPWMFARSRNYRASRPYDFSPPVWFDRFLSLLERVLVGAGCRVGEETILLLEKAHDL